jgi:hypothetical protein
MPPLLVDDRLPEHRRPCKDRADHHPHRSLINPADAILSITITSDGRHEVTVAVAELLLEEHTYTYAQVEGRTLNNNRPRRG